MKSDPMMKDAEAMREITLNAMDPRLAVTLEDLERKMLHFAKEGGTSMGADDFGHERRLDVEDAAMLKKFGYTVKYFGKTGKRGWKVSW